VDIHDNKKKAQMQEKWFKDSLSTTGLQWLKDVNYGILDHNLLSAFVERWHEETSSIHLPMEDMIVTPDDVICLLHLPI